MKILFLFLFSSLHATCIVFVHIGKELPEYLYPAIEQVRLFNRDCPIYIVANEKAILSSPPFGDDIHIIACETLKPSPSHDLFIQTSQLDRRSFEGFWLYTSERFFYLEELIRRENLKDIFHLENDVMLYVDC